MFVSLVSQPVCGIPSACLALAVIIPVKEADKTISEPIRKVDSRISLWSRYGHWVVAVAIGIPFFIIDQLVRDIGQNPAIHSRTADSFFLPVHIFGMGWGYAVVIMLLVGYGIAYKRSRPFVIGGELLSGLIAGGILARGFKMSVGRLRPWDSVSPFNFFKDGYSFYSGDVSAAFIFATIISKEYPRQNLSFVGINRDLPLVPILSYSVAILVALQRLYSNKHWVSDVYYGAIAGCAVGLLGICFRRKIGLRQLDNDMKKSPGLIIRSELS
jgi:membrane-associated phospholipid phosphatase